MKPLQKNQHWVPQFYLREFAIPETRRQGEDKEQVWIFSRNHSDGIETKAANVKNVAAKKFLYSPLRDDGTRSFEVEDMLGEVEDLLAKFWHRFATGLVDLDTNQALRKGLAWFIALLHARHPDQLEVAETVDRQMHRIYDSAPKDDNGLPIVSIIGDDGKPHRLDMSGWKPANERHDKQSSHHLWVETIQALTIDLTENLLRKKWAIVVAPTPVFVTSDRPVYLINDEREHFGIRTKGTQVVFPISPTRLLLAHDNEAANETNKYVHLKKTDALKWNFLTWVHTNRFLISSFEPTSLLADMVLESERYDRIQANINRPKTQRTGRNQRCPCGSRKKYKLCCGRVGL